MFTIHVFGKIHLKTNLKKGYRNVKENELFKTTLMNSTIKNFVPSWQVLRKIVINFFLHKFKNNPHFVNTDRNGQSC